MALTLAEVNRRLDRLYAKLYDLECTCLYELDEAEHQEWVRVTEALHLELVELECRQDELVEANNLDCAAWVQRQAGY